MANASLLHLNLRRTYFDQIAQGGKKTEYRDRSAYWAKRLEGRAYDLIVFRNGYGPDLPEMWVSISGRSQGGEQSFRTLCHPARKDREGSPLANANRMILPDGVITGLVPVIHVLTFFFGDKDVDGRVEPGHDEWREGTP